jgi:hypothetical protein
MVSQCNKKIIFKLSDLNFMEGPIRILEIQNEITLVFEAELIVIVH